MSIASPIRYPNTGSERVMTRRGWWLVVLNLVLPGSAQLVAGSRRLGRVGIIATLVLWIAGIVAAIVYLASHRAGYELLTASLVLVLVQAALIRCSGGGWDSRCS